MGFGGYSKGTESAKQTWTAKSKFIQKVRTSKAAKAHADAEDKGDKGKGKASGSSAADHQREQRKVSSLDIPTDGSLDSPWLMVLGMRLVYGSNGYAIATLILRYGAIIHDTNRGEIVLWDKLIGVLMDICALNVIGMRDMAEADNLTLAGGASNYSVTESALVALDRIIESGVISNVAAPYANFLGRCIAADGKFVRRHSLMVTTAPARIGGLGLPLTAGTAAQKFDAAQRLTDATQMGFEIYPGYCCCVLGLYGANSNWADTTAVLNHLGTAAPRDFPSTYFAGLERVWTETRARGPLSVYNHVTNGLTANGSLTACLTQRGWLGGLQGWDTVRNSFIEMVNSAESNHPIALLPLKSIVPTLSPSGLLRKEVHANGFSPYPNTDIIIKDLVKAPAATKLECLVWSPVVFPLNGDQLPGGNAGAQIDIINVYNPNGSCRATATFSDDQVSGVVAWHVQDAKKMNKS